MAEISAQTVTLSPAKPVMPEMVADLIYATDPAMFDGLHGGHRALARRHLAQQWLATTGVFSHKLATAAWADERLIGISLGFRAETQDDEAGPFIERAKDVLAEDEFVGMVTWWRSTGRYMQPVIPEDAFYLQNLSVDPAARGLGIGRRLLEDTFNRSRAAGFDRVHLDVIADSPAVKLYERAGMTRLVETRIHAGNGTHVALHLRMEKML